MANRKLETHSFAAILALFQLAFLIIIFVWGEHKSTALPDGVPSAVEQINYTDFQDVQITLIIGFGFLVVFLRRYGFSAFGLSLLLVAFTIEWALIVRGFFSTEFRETSTFYFSIHNLIKADFTAAVVLVTFGVLIGKLSPVQCLVLAFIETPVSIGVENALLNQLKVQDIGGGLTVHLFGALFGIAAASAIRNERWISSEHIGSVYHSELISFIGAGFLWVFWPAFNAVNAVGNARQRCIINSYIALLGSTIAAFLFSQVLEKNKHFNIRHIASASLAGGVALGACANLLLKPSCALFTGLIAGAVSIISFHKITPLLGAKLKAHDTRGAFSLHGVPAIIGGLAGAITLFFASENAFPLTSRILGENRKNTDQALIQLLALLIVVGTSVVSGLITGFILKQKFLSQVRENQYYCDQDYFNVPDDYDFTTRITSQIDRVELNEITPPTSVEAKPLVESQTTAVGTQPTPTIDETNA